MRLACKEAVKHLMARDTINANPDSPRKMRASRN
jgi:hypothetical protein